MSDHRDPREPELRERFAALRREEEQGAPPFAAVREAVRTRGRRPASSRGLLAPAAAAAAALCLLLVWLTGRTPPPALPGAGLDLADWRPPTDFLLQTPGREILTAPDWLERGFAAEDPAWGLSPLTPTNERRNRS